MTTEYSYNNTGYLDKMREITANSSDRMTINYRYGPAGNLKTKTRIGVGIYNDETTTQYTYDSADKLKQATTMVSGITPSLTNMAYAYDMAGNATSDGVNTFVYDIGNRVITKTEIATGRQTRYTYDTDGNLINSMG